LKLGKKRRESSKRNYYIFSPRVIIKAIIINNAGKLGAGFISVCVQTRWLGLKRGFHVLG